MPFLDRMAAGEAIVDRHRAGEIDRDTALVELTIEFDGTVITNEGIQRFLDRRTDHTEGGPARATAAQARRP